MNAIPQYADPGFPWPGAVVASAREAIRITQSTEVNTVDRNERSIILRIA